MGFINTFQRMSVDELRTEVIGLLKKAYSDGRITVDTLERRLKEATGAGDKEALLALVSDIPEPETDSASSTAEENTERPWLINNRVPRESQSFFAVLGASNRIGRWQPARNITCLSLMGGVKLDFREAEFPRDGIRINAGCIMGGLDVVIPPGINADISGIPLLGGIENKAGAGDERAPTLTIRGIAIMGGIEIKRKELKQKRQRPGMGNGRTRGRKNRKEQQQDRFYDYE